MRVYVRDKLIPRALRHLQLRAPGEGARESTVVGEPTLYYTFSRLPKGRKITVSLEATDGGENVGSASWSFKIR